MAPCRPGPDERVQHGDPARPVDLAGAGPAGRHRVAADGERGSAVVEFVLVSVLLVALVAGVLQLALVLHVRNTLIDSASEGARHGALVGGSSAAASQRTRDLIDLSLASRYGDDVVASEVTRGGLDLVEVRVRAPLPVIGLLGPSGVLDVTGRAVREE
ncbi:TadE/TadG family type IV pilus assembly protein [Georgenia wangjunii]|uniref:TadE/TadG family type IV pilus assembly protein n=1 Tax=Georgenia wangjunii TaxID=3117730 RepID=UPI002F26AAB7